MLTGLIVSSYSAAANEWVSSFKGAPSQYTITRGSKVLKPSPLQKLQEGDVVKVLGAGGRIGILKADKSVFAVTKSNSPYTVPKSVGGASVWDNLIGIASGWVGDGGADSTHSFAAAEYELTISPVSPAIPAIRT